MQGHTKRVRPECWQQLVIKAKCGGTETSYKLLYVRSSWVRVSKKGSCDPTRRMGALQAANFFDQSD